MKKTTAELEILDTDIELIPSENLVGKTIKFDLTKILKGRGSEALFKLEKVNDVLVGKLYKFSLYSSYVSRIIDKGVSIVEDSFECKTKDSTVRVKPFMITRKKVHRNVRKALRNEFKSTVEKMFLDYTTEEIFRDIFAGTLQKTLSKKLKKLYPLAVCEIRVLELLKGNKG